MRLSLGRVESRLTFRFALKRSDYCGAAKRRHWHYATYFAEEVIDIETAQKKHPLERRSPVQAYDRASGVQRIGKKGWTPIRRYY